MLNEATQLSVDDFTWGAWSAKQPLTLWMDTWYATSMAEDIGGMLLDRATSERESSSTGENEGNGSFLLSQALLFARSFAHMVQVVGLRFVYQDDLIPMATVGYSVNASSETDWLREAETAARERKTFASLYVTFDLLLSVRSTSGRLMRDWLPAAGYLWIVPVPLAPNDMKQFYPDPPSHPGAHGVISSEAWDRGVASMRHAAVAQHWQATLQCEVGSLFNEDNSEILAHTRDAWRLNHKLQRKRAQRRQEMYGDVVTAQNDDDELSDEDGSSEELAAIRRYEGTITLAAPPPETPATNAELYALNAERLAEGIAAWERETGNHFRYEPFLRDSYPE